MWESTWVKFGEASMCTCHLLEELLGYLEIASARGVITCSGNGGGEWMPRLEVARPGIKLGVEKLGAPLICLSFLDRSSSIAFTIEN
jgi:hypothetical protein